MDLSDDRSLLHDDAALREILEGVRTIAVLGIKSGDADDAFRVPSYLKSHGYRILPVNPKLESVLGEPAAPDLASLRDRYDLLDVFRAPEHVPAHVDEILALPLERRPRVVWLQQGIRDDASAARLRDAGIAVVQDACLMVVHRRLLAGT